MKYRDKAELPEDRDSDKVLPGRGELRGGQETEQCCAEKLCEGVKGGETGGNTGDALLKTRISSSFWGQTVAFGARVKPLSPA